MTNSPSFTAGKTARRAVRIVLTAAALAMIPGAQSFASPAGPATEAEFQNLRTALKSTNASDDVRLVANWIMRTNKHKGRPFIVADKVGGLLFAFHANGELVAKTRALYGAERSDTMTKEQADKTWDEMVASDRITPAGIFPAQPYRSPAYGPSVKFAEYANSNLIIHRAPVEWRRKHLQSTAKSNVRVTYGCINVLPDFIDNVLLPVFNGESTVIILPETQSAKSFFGIDDAVATAQ